MRIGCLVAFVVSLALVVGMISERPVPAPSYRTLGMGSPANHVAVIGDSYTNGTGEGGEGPKAWTALVWRMLARQGVQVSPDVAAEGRAGYGVPGDQGSFFEDLTGRAVHPDDALVVFFGSRNDQGADLERLAEMVHGTLDLARRTAPSARLLVIGPPWPTADPPDVMLKIRDILNDQARAVGADFDDPMAQRWFVGEPYLIGPDEVHPNDAGHAYLADKIAPLIRAQLPGQT